MDDFKLVPAVRMVTLLVFAAYLVVGTRAREEWFAPEHEYKKT